MWSLVGVVRSLVKVVIWMGAVYGVFLGQLLRPLVDKGRTWITVQQGIGKIPTIPTISWAQARNALRWVNVVRGTRSLPELARRIMTRL